MNDLEFGLCGSSITSCPQRRSLARTAASHATPSLASKAQAIPSLASKAHVTPSLTKTAKSRQSSARTSSNNKLNSSSVSNKSYTSATSARQSVTKSAAKLQNVKKKNIQNKESMNTKLENGNVVRKKPAWFRGSHTSTQRSYGGDDDNDKQLSLPSLDDSMQEVLSPVSTGSDDNFWKMADDIDSTCSSSRLSDRRSSRVDQSKHSNGANFDAFTSDRPSPAYSPRTTSATTSATISATPLFSSPQLQSTTSISPTLSASSYHRTGTTSGLFDFISTGGGKQEDRDHRMTSADLEAIDDDDYTFRTLTPQSRRSDDDHEGINVRRDTLAASEDDAGARQNTEPSGCSPITGGAIASNTRGLENKGAESDRRRKIAESANRNSNAKGVTSRMLTQNKNKGMDSLDAAGDASDVSEQLDESECPASSGNQRLSTIDSPRVDQLATLPAQLPNTHSSSAIPSSQHESRCVPLMGKAFAEVSLATRDPPTTCAPVPALACTSPTPRVRNSASSTTPGVHLSSASRLSFSRSSLHTADARHYAAIAVQRWYRAMKKKLNQRATREADVRTSMQARIDQLKEERRLRLDNDMRLRRQVFDDDNTLVTAAKSPKQRKEARELKAQQARKKAIQEMQERREKQKLLNKKIAEEEVEKIREKSRSIRSIGSKGKVTKSSGNRLASQETVRPTSGDGCEEEAAAANIRTRGTPRAGAAVKGHSTATTAAEVGSTGATSCRQSESSSAAVAGNTTMDDLFATLRNLEQDVGSGRIGAAAGAAGDGAGDRKTNSTLSWLNELDREVPSPDVTDPKDSSISSQGHSGQHNTVHNFLDRNRRLDDIFENSSTSSSGRRPVHTSDPVDLIATPTDGQLDELVEATATASAVTSKMLLQNVELQAKSRNIDVLKTALNQQKELTIRHAKDSDREMNQRLKSQKLNHEQTMKRHLSFIDQLIDDKKLLTEKCESLVTELKGIQKKYTDEINIINHKHTNEINKQKETFSASEKFRREKWIDEKTKKIKEMTVKGLEPEIQRLISTHKAELKRLKSLEQAELLAADERAAQRYVTMTEELRDQLAKEKESACARERELARQTYEKQVRQEEEAYQNQRRRLYAEVAEEKERIADQASRMRSECDRIQRQNEDGQRNASAALKEEYDIARQEVTRRHEAEVSHLKEQLAIEKTEWQETYMKKKEAWLLGRERELKEAVKKDRDTEIELVIRRLEDDSQSACAQAEHIADNRVKRIRDKYEKEIEELERSEKQTRVKFNETKAELAEVDGENRRKDVLLSQKDKEIEELKKLLERLNEERSRVSDVVRQEFADRLVATENQSQRIKSEITELRAHQKVELENARQEIVTIETTKNEEMELVHARVKQAILKKEEIVNQLKVDCDSANKRVDHLESLLQQQRKQLLKK